MKLFMRAMLALAALVASAAPASATSFDFSYLMANGNTLSGVLTGNLQSDNNTVLLTGVTSLSLNGTAFTESMAVFSTDDAIYQTTAYTPTLTLNASYLDFGVTDGNDYLAFAVGDRTAAYIGANATEATSGFGGSGNAEYYMPNNFTVSRDPGSTGLSQTASVPEPASWAMMLIGFGCIGFAVRRRGVHAIV